AIKTGYIKDSVLSKVLANPLGFTEFSMRDGLIYARNTDGQECLAIPRDVRLHGRRNLTEIVIDQAHKTLGHLGNRRTAEYICRWYWW
ncbi:hypothetical protein K438DRAFT_1458505, partial [Mycena galopus ATCC 62051]